MDDDWDIDEPSSPQPSNPLSGPTKPTLAPPVRAPARGKWEGEDEDDEDDDWDKSEDEKPKASNPSAAPAKKKMSLKQKLAEKERLAQEKLLNGDDDDELIPTMTEQDRRRMARERELEADLDAANDLFADINVNKSGTATPANGTSTPNQGTIFTTKPKTKEDFNVLAKLIATEVTGRHVSNPLYASFVESLSKELCEGLNAVQTRKVSSTLSVLGNTKQAEERDKASGKKKTTAGKPKLGGAKTINRVDTEAYDDVLDDDDFM